MKKILSVLMLSLLIVAPSISNAQTISKEDVRTTLAPQLLNLFATASVSLSGIQTKMSAQNLLIAGDLNTLSVISRRLGTTPEPTTQEIENMSRLVSSVSADVESVTSWRPEVDRVVKGLSTLISQISLVISAAV